MGLKFSNGLTKSIYLKGKYVQDVLKRFGMSDCMPIATPIIPRTINDEDEAVEAINEAYFK